MMTRYDGEIMAGYVRLSKEDEIKQLESESVQNQRELLKSYAEERGWKIHNIYVDEDYSGVDSMRPGFNQLLSDAEKGRFSIVVCKSQSRFTRDMEAVEKYIHSKFPLWGVRFISIVDNADTSVKSNKKARQINGLINEWYLEDLSENVKTVLNHKRINGHFIGAFPTYGYQKDPENHNHLIPDPVAAEVVRRIYALYLSGMGKGRISDLLNSEGIPNPAAYKKRSVRYSAYHCGGTGTKWNPTTISRILQEPNYVGDLAQGRKKKASYKSKKMQDVPKRDWIVVKDTHEPIIDRDMFELVQELRYQRTLCGARGVGKVHALNGKVKCMDCGSALNKYQMTYKGNKKYYLNCKLYRNRKLMCTAHSIRLDLLEQEVMRLLRRHIHKHYEMRSAGEYLGSDRCRQKKEACQTELRGLRQQLARATASFSELYSDRAAGVITVNDFARLSPQLQEDMALCEVRISQLEAELESLEAQKLDLDMIQRKIGDWLNFNELTRELIVGFIDSIKVGERDPVTKKQEIHITWLF